MNPFLSRLRLVLLALPVVLGLSLLPAAAAQSASQTALTAAAANVQLGVGYLRRGNLAVAQQVLERSFAQNPKDPNVHTALGLLYERLAQPERADDHYGRAVKLAPQDPEILNNYAVFLCRRGQAPRGEKMFLQAAANPLYRTPEVALTNAGVCARGAGRTVEAEQYLRRALALQPAFTDALLPLAEISLAKGNAFSARAFLERLLAAAPATAEGLALGIGIETAAGDAVAVATYRERLAREFPQSAAAREAREPVAVTQPQAPEKG